MKSLRARAIVYGLIVLVGVLSALPSLLPNSSVDRLTPWYSSNQLALGLDLRGGSHLLLNVDTSELGFQALSATERANRPERCPGAQSGDGPAPSG